MEVSRFWPPLKGSHGPPGPLAYSSEYCSSRRGETLKEPALNIPAYRE